MVIDSFVVLRRNNSAAGQALFDITVIGGHVGGLVVKATSVSSIQFSSTKGRVEFIRSHTKKVCAVCFCR